MPITDKLLTLSPNSKEIKEILVSREKKLKIASITLEELTWLLFFKKKNWLFDAVDIWLPDGILKKLLKSKDKKNANIFFIDTLEETTKLGFTHLIAGLSMPLSKNLIKNIKRLIPNFKSISNISQDMISAYPKESQILLKKTNPQVVILKSEAYLENWINMTNVFDLKIHFLIFGETLNVYARSIKKKRNPLRFFLKPVTLLLKSPLLPFYLYTLLFVYFTKSKNPFTSLFQKIKFKLKKPKL